jgi:hypothetical protein
MRPLSSVTLLAILACQPRFRNQRAFGGGVFLVAWVKKLARNSNLLGTL